MSDNDGEKNSDHIAPKKKGHDRWHLADLDIEKLANAAFRAVQALAIVVLLGWALSEHEFILAWMKGVNHAEFFGAKFDREAIDKVNSGLEELLKSKDGKNANPDFARGAIIRALKDAPAIVGAKLLWVDDNPKNNALLLDVLKRLKIDVIAVTSTKAALDVVRNNHVDLIVSDVRRENDKDIVPLHNCRVHYFYLPNGVSESNIDKFNVSENEHGQAGFSLAEYLNALPEAPPLVFYSAETAEIARSLCGDAITNRPDILLHTIVSLLGQQRWAALQDKT